MTEMTNAAKPMVTTRQATKQFLHDVVEVVEKTYPIWEKRLSSFIDETQLDIDEKRKLLEIHPARHYFYAAVVGIEAAKIKSLFQPELAEDLLADINDMVDEISGRKDQLVSDLIFDIIQRVKVTDSNETIKAHDIALNRINDLLHITSMDATKEMAQDVVFRQELAHPLAASVHHWWSALKNSGQLEQTVSSPERTHDSINTDGQTFKVASATR